MDCGNPVTKYLREPIKGEASFGFMASKDSVHPHVLAPLLIGLWQGKSIRGETHAKRRCLPPDSQKAGGGGQGKGEEEVTQIRQIL